MKNKGGSGNISHRGPSAPGGDTAVAPGGAGEFHKTLSKLQGGLSVEKGTNQSLNPGKD